LLVGVRQLQQTQFFPSDPPQVLTNHRSRLSKDVAPAEVQPDRFFRIGVFRLDNLFVNDRVDAKFLVELTAQALFVRLMPFALAAREFPQAGEVRAVQSSRQEKPAVALDHRCYDDNCATGSGIRGHCSCSGLNGNARQFGVIGQTRHFGLRAEQSVAPKSMSA